MHDSNRVLSQTDAKASAEDQAREWEADEQEREALLQAWKSFRLRHAGEARKWSHELIDEERGDRC